MDYALESTFDVKFTSRIFATGVPGTLAGSPVVEIYEDNGTTQITTAETLTVDFDSVTGLNNLRIVATAANGFEAGKSYSAVISVGTVSGVSVVGEVVCNFTIGRITINAASVDAVWDEAITNSVHNDANSAGKRLRQASASLSAESTVNDASASTTTFVTALTEATDDHYNNCTLTFLDGALAGQSRVIADYNGTTKAVTFDEALTDAPANGAEFQIAADHVHPVSEIADAVLDEVMSGHTAADSLGLFLNDQYDLAVTGITTGVETRAGKHSVAGTVMMSTNAALSGGSLTAKKPSDDTTFATYTVTTDAAANNITGMS
jgi:hypothetical protein